MEQEIEIKLTIVQLNAILQALGKQPAEISMDLILELRKQAEPQLSKA